MIGYLYGGSLVSIYEKMEYVNALLIVQPIGENAIFHGAMSKKNGWVDIKYFLCA